MDPKLIEWSAPKTPLISAGVLSFRRLRRKRIGHACTTGKQKKNDQINFSLTVRQEHMGRCDAVRWPVGPRDGLAWPGRQNKLGPPHCFLFIYLLFRFLCLLAVIFLPYLREHFVLTLEERLDRWMRNYIMKLDR